MSISALELIIGGIAVALLVLWIWSLVDALGRPDAEWEETGHSKLIWILVIVFVGFIGPVLYLLTARPQLERAKRGV